jgi:iron complex outermembrane receptor protein
VEDERLGITRIARETPNYVWSLGLDQSLPQWKSNFGLSLQLSGRSLTDIPNEQYAYRESRALLDAFWLYQMHPKFNLRVSAQNLLGEDVVLRNRYLQTNDEWQYNNREYAYRSVMFFIEGKL